MKRKIETKNLAMIILGISIVIICFLGGGGSTYEKLFKNYFVTESIGYLDETIEKSSIFFMSISVAKGIVAMIEGSQVGLSAFGHVAVEVGDVVQPLYDIINIIWKISLLSLSSLGIQKLVMLYLPLKLLDILVGCFIITRIPVCFVKNIITKFLYKVSRFVLIITVVGYFLIPLSIFLSSRSSVYLYNEYRKPVEQQMEVEFQKLSNIRKSIESINIVEKNGDEKEGWMNSILNPIETSKGVLKNAIDEMKGIIAHMEGVTGNVFRGGIILAAMYLFEGVLLPLLFLFLIYLFIKVVILEDLKIVEKTSILVKDNK